MSQNSNNAVVIIGGGTFGLFIAHELMLAERKSIIIESGNEEIQSFNKTQYKSIGHKHAGISIGRTKGIGGTSNLWGGQLTKFTINDFASTSHFGQPIWPITWEEMQPFYDGVMKRLGFNKYSDYSSVLSQKDSDDVLEYFYTNWLKIPNVKAHFYKDLQRSELVTIYENTTVTNLNFLGKQCISIEVSDGIKKRKINVNDDLILANGTIEISRLLLIASQSKDCPFHDNKWIGKYFQDHLGLKVGLVKNASKEFFSKFSNVFKSGNKLQPKLRFYNKDLSNSYLGVCAMFAFSSDLSQHLDLFKQFVKAVIGRSTQKVTLKELLGLFIRSIKILPSIFPLILKYFIDNKIYVPFNSTVNLCLQTQQISLIESQIRLSNSEFDTLGRPKAILDWKIDGREIDTINRFCLEIKAYLKKEEFGDLVLEKWLDKTNHSIDNEWIKYASDTYHQSGGAIMSHSPSEGVTDRNLKVHNTSNLYICGGSVMPTSSYSNTGLTTFALAYRLSNWISKKGSESTI